MIKFSSDDINSLILGYLETEGYAKTAQCFKEEIGRECDVKYCLRDMLIYSVDMMSRSTGKKSVEFGRFINAVSWEAGEICNIDGYIPEDVKDWQEATNKDGTNSALSNFSVPVIEARNSEEVCPAAAGRTKEGEKVSLDFVAELVEHATQTVHCAWISMNRLVTVTSDGTIRLFHGRCLKEIKTSRKITCVNAYGNTTLMGDADGRLFEVDFSDNPVSIRPIHAVRRRHNRANVDPSVNAVGVLNGTVFSGSSSGILTIDGDAFDTGFSGINSLEFFGGNVVSYGAFNGEISAIVVLGKERGVRRVEKIYSTSTHKGRVNCLRAYGDGLFSSGEDGKIKMQRIPGRFMSILNEEAYKSLMSSSERERIPVQSFLYSHDGPIYQHEIRNNVVYSVSEDQTMKVFDLHAMKLINTFKHDGPVNALIVDDVILTGSSDKTVRLWDRRSGEITRMSFRGPILDIKKRYNYVCVLIDRSSPTVIEVRER